MEQIDLGTSHYAEGSVALDLGAKEKIYPEWMINRRYGIYASRLKVKELPVTVSTYELVQTESCLKVKRIEYVYDKEDYYGHTVKRRRKKQKEDILVYDMDHKKLDFDIKNIKSKLKLASSPLYKAIATVLVEWLYEQNVYIADMLFQYKGAAIEYQKDERNVNIVINLLTHSHCLDKIEAFGKTLGRNALVENLFSKDFKLQEKGKKLKQVVELPGPVISKAKKLSMVHFLSELKLLGPDNALLLVNFIEAFRKSFPGLALKPNVERFSREILKIFATGKFTSIKVLLSYLVLENVKFGTFGLPETEASLLRDYLAIKSDACENLPRNIYKSHFVAMKNYSVLQKPRPEEFKEAVDKYRYLEDKEDKNYVFLVPKDEADLVKEGNELSHCIATYRDKIIQNTKIVFMREKDRPDKSFVTIEYEDGKILQSKQAYNEDVIDPGVIYAMNLWLNRVEKKENALSA